MNPEFDSVSHTVHLPVTVPGANAAAGAAQAVAPTPTPTQPADAIAGGAISAAAAEPRTSPVAMDDPRRPIHEKLLEGKVIAAICTIFDPEIPVNIYELGLIYEIKIRPDDSVDVKMTLTAPACPVAGTLPGDVEIKINAIPEVTAARVELVWEPAWSRERMSEAALLQLGFL